MPFCFLVPFPEERDKKRIMGILSLFSLVSLRAFVNFRTCNPLAMFFISYELYVYEIFFNEKGMFVGFFRLRVEPTTRSESSLFFRINIFRPATGLAVPPLHSTFLTPLAEVGMRWA